MSDSFELRERSFKEVITTLLGNADLVMLIMSLVGLLYVVTGCQYWLANYLEKVLNVSKGAAATYFSVSGITAPALGVVVGNKILTKYGGYESLEVLQWL